MKRVLLIFAILLVLATAASFFGLDRGLLWGLMFGWINGFGYILYGLAHEPIAVAIGLTAFVLLPFAMFQFLRGFLKADNDSRLFKKSLAVVIGFCSLAMTAIALIAVIHAVHWLVYPKEPIFASSPRGKEYDVNQMKAIALGIHLYSDFNNSDSNKMFPSGGTILKDGRPGHGWMVPILPYVNAGHLLHELDLDKPWNESPNTETYKNAIPYEYLNHFHTNSLRIDSSGRIVRDAEGFITTDFAANERAMPFGRALQIRDFSDGTSNTLLIGEAGKNQQPWGSPFNGRDPAIGLNRSPWGFNGSHPGVVIFALADGSAHPISESINPRVLKALSTPNGDEY